MEQENTITTAQQPISLDNKINVKAKDNANPNPNPNPNPESLIPHEPTQKPSIGDHEIGFSPQAEIRTNEPYSKAANDVYYQALYQADTHRLLSHFGKDRWQQIKPQLQAWGKTHLPAALFQNLSNHYEGVVLLHRMMHSTQEVSLISKSATQVQGATQEGLRQMIRDPRYWRDQDPIFRQRVAQGYRQLYPET